LFDSEFTARVIDVTSLKTAGMLKINLSPTDSTGEADGSPLEEDLNDPEDLIGQTIYFHV
jgi:hypothetical protein